MTKTTLSSKQKMVKQFEIDDLVYDFQRIYRELKKLVSQVEMHKIITQVERE